MKLNLSNKKIQILLVVLILVVALYLYFFVFNVREGKKNRNKKQKNNAKQQATDVNNKNLEIMSNLMYAYNTQLFDSLKSDPPKDRLYLLDPSEYVQDAPNTRVTVEDVVDDEEEETPVTMTSSFFD